MSTYIFAIGLCIRIFLLSTPAHTVLQSRPELSTPLTSWRHLQEGLYIYSRGGDPYNGGVFYHSPLYLVFAHLSTTWSAVIWILADCISALALIRIWHSRKQTQRTALVAAAYLLNPYAIATCAARSTTAIDNAVLLSAIAQAANGHVASGCGLLAIAAQSTMYPVGLLIPMTAAKPVRGVITFISISAMICAISFALVGYNWPGQTWGTALFVSDLTPNVGMWWYFFTEMFDHFRPFFLGVFQLHNVIYLAPLCLRIDPMINILVSLGIFSTWKSYPQLGDHAAWIALLSCFPEIVSRLRHPLFTASVHLYTAILLPLLHSLWLLTGAGNANFFYAATMVYGLNASLAVVDVLGASFKTELAVDGDIVQLTSL